MREVYQKKGKKSLLKGHSREFLPLIFSKFWDFQVLPSPEQHVILKVYTVDKVFYPSKMTLCEGTAPNKRLE